MQRVLAAAVSSLLVLCVHQAGVFADEGESEAAGVHDPSSDAHASSEAAKRAWKDLHGSWGKRGWNDLQGVWGKRGPAPPNLSSVWRKRGDWNAFRGSWGKREGNWNNLKGLWGKRADGNWNNLKGLWGKRSDGQWNKLGALWGKRNPLEDSDDDLMLDMEALQNEVALADTK